MNVLKKLLAILEISIIMFSMVLTYSSINVKAQMIPFRQKPIKIAVFLYDFKDTYISLVHANFEEIQKNNEGKVEFTFYDGKNDQSVQNINIDAVLESENTNAIFLNLVDTKVTRTVIDKIKYTNIPVILFNREPIDIQAIKSYNKAFFVGTDAKEAGTLQGKILINAWNNNKETIDKNKDNTMQYLMLMGEKNNIEAVDRTKYSVLSINDAGIKTQEIALNVCDWNREIARSTVDSLFSTKGNIIEVIISNNDEMAIGAIEALQKYGYNTGNKALTIPVVGVDAIPEAKELIKKGFMTGTVLQDPKTMTEVIYNIGMNLVYKKQPLDAIKYKFDDTGVAVRLPYNEYVG